MSNGTPPPPNPPASPNPLDRFDQIEGQVNLLTNKIDSLLQAVEAVKTATNKAQKSSALLPLWCALIAGVIGAAAAIIGSLITAHATIEASQKTLESAAKVAFESARGTKASEDYKNAKRLITEIEVSFRESAVQRSVKKSLEDDLAKLSSLALWHFQIRCSFAYRSHRLRGTTPCGLFSEEKALGRL